MAEQEETQERENEIGRVDEDVVFKKKGEQEEEKKNKIK